MGNVMEKTERTYIQIVVQNTLLVENEFLSIWSLLAQREREKSNVFITASVQRSVIVCDNRLGCANHMALGIKIICVREPEINPDRDAYSLALKHVVEEIKEFYKESFVYIITEEVNIQHFI